MKLEFFISNTENITPLSDKDIQQMQEIITALISTGGMTRVKGGQTAIHFDNNGVFQRIELKYYPYIKRK